ncbi:Interleukin-17 receptor D [Labeo rohita]|uniref:Interleukin-17 receptor D n=1 Tax=Labeo rohita TaxID=84645 RepID=A0ABQ8MAV6_LABRO|nr:Interleukin-17 receptor D [Labeo rohita]
MCVVFYHLILFISCDLFDLLGIEHVKGFRVYLEDKNPEGKQCQHMILKDPRQLNFSYKTVRMSSQPFAGLAFETDYMVRIVPFPTFLNDSFFPPSFLRTNSCEVLLGPDNLVCKPFWKPKMLNVSQLGSNLHVVFDHAPSTFGFTIYYLYYKLRQEGPFRLKRCKPEQNGPKTTCVLQDVTPGTYAIELRDDNNTTRKQTQYHVSQVHSPWAGPIRAMAITVPLVIMSAFATLFTVMCRKKQQGAYPSLARLGFPPFCRVALDLWEHLEICKEGQMSWLSRRIDEAHFIITVCSKGLKYFVEKRHRKGKATSKEKNREPSASDSTSNRDLFIVATAMIAEKIKEVHQKSSDLSRFMSVYFDYSHESDIPTSLSLAPKYKLMDQLPQLFARLHSRQLSLTDREPQPPNVSKRNYFRSKSGRSLYVAICNMHQHIEQEPDWFEKQLMPPPPPNKRLPPPEKLDSGLVLNEVKLKHPSESDCPVRSNVIILPPTPKLGLSLSLSQDDLGEGSSHQDAGSSRPDGSASPAEMPRDSGIYDSSVPSSELSIPLMDGLSPDHDNSSLADSVSSSSGLGDEEPPAVSSLHCAAPTICKAELHHNIHQSEGLIAAAST